jgi:hypothetical protein
MVENSQDKSAASFCCQLAAWFSDMFGSFYLLKNRKIANNSATTEARFGIFIILEIHL